MVGFVVMAAAFAGCGPNVNEMRTKATTEYQVGHAQQAQEQFLKILDREPSDPITLYYLGRINMEQNRLEMAIYYFQCCLDADPSFAAARQDLRRAEQLARPIGSRLRFIPKSPGDANR
jgi:tetratricopeptide (TPR) repeat protein